MNKGELIEKVANNSEMSKADAEKVFNSLLSTITQTIATGDKVTLIGFGTFSVSDRTARKRP
jgi:DNA-binding protein HU-beta